MRFKLIRRNTNTLSVEIDRKDCIPIIKAPLFLQKSKILNFLNKHIKWIKKRVKNCKDSYILYEHRDRWPLFGKLIALKTSLNVPLIPHYEADSENILINPTIFKLNHSDFRSIVYRFYKELLYPKLKPRLRVYLGAIGQDYNNLFIRNSLRRWGSCSVLRNLNFSFRLAWLPYKLIDYIVAHEVAHLVYMNHSKKFWSLVERLDKHYKKHRRELKDWEKYRVV